MKPKNVDPAFRDRLQRLLREYEMTQADLARKLFGVALEARPDGKVYEVAKNRQTIARYLSGKTYPSEDTKQKLAEAFDVPMSELFPADDPVNKPGSGITMYAADNRNSVLNLHLVMPTEKAMEVIKMVSEYAK